MRPGNLSFAAVVLAGLALVAAPVHARPRFSLAAGTAFAGNGDPGTGGAALAAGIAFPVEGPWSFGVRGFVDDHGTSRIELRDPNDGTPLGRVGDAHRWTYGAEWVGAYALRNTKRSEWSWTAGFGYGHQELDQRGEIRGAVSGITFSTGTTYLVPLANGHRVGISLLWRGLAVSRDSDAGRTTQGTVAALEWQWQGAPKDR
jgi:hypothetical protein